MGPRGPPGPPGLPGNNETNGEAGPKGEQGVEGKPGAKGDKVGFWFQQTFLTMLQTGRKPVFYSKIPVISPLGYRPIFLLTQKS